MVSHSKPHPRRSASAPPKREGEAEPGRESGQPRSGARSGGRRPEHGACGPVADRYAGTGLRRPTGDAHAAARAGAAPARTERYKIARESSSPERAAWVRAPWSWVGCWGSVHAARRFGLRACAERASDQRSNAISKRRRTRPETPHPDAGAGPDRGVRGLTRTGSARRGYRQ